MTVQRLRDVSGLSLGQANPVRLGDRTESAGVQGKSAAEMKADHQEWVDEQPTSTSCLFCDWTFAGTAAECRDEARAHREAAHPEATVRRARHGRRLAPKGARTEEENQQAALNRADANRARAEREDADRLAKIERGRHRDALADGGEPQGREEEPEAHSLAVEPLAPQQPAGSPPPRDESGLEETPVAEDAAGTRGVADVSSSPITHDEGTTMGDSTSTNGRAKKWPRERVIAAIQAVAAEVGATPTIPQMVERGYSFAPSCTKLGLGKWSELVAEAGFAPNKQGGATRSGREPLAGKAGGAHGAPPVEPPVTPAATPVAEPASRPEQSLVVVAALRDPIRTADIPYDAEILEDEADFLRQRAAALEQIAAGVRALASASRRDVDQDEELAA